MRSYIRVGLNILCYERSDVVNIVKPERTRQTYPFRGEKPAIDPNAEVDTISPSSASARPEGHSEYKS